MIKPERVTTNITLKNEPKLSTFEVDQVSDERRLALVPHIKYFVENDELFAGKDVSVEFSHGGFSSLVAFIEIPDKKYVMKMPLSLENNGEVLFLNAWEKVGVSVPHVLREGTIGGYQYILMNFIDAPVLKEKLKDGEDNGDIYVNMGETLAKMHTTKSEGYGMVVDGAPEYTDFRDWINGEFVSSKIKAVEEAKLLDESHGSVSSAIDILVAYSEVNRGSTYCHFDFNPENILATDLITVFDPEPMFNLGLLDLGHSIVVMISKGRDYKKLIEGYFGGNSFNAEALQAAILLNAYLKFPYWNKKNQTLRISRVQQYLIENKPL